MSQQSALPDEIVQLLTQRTPAERRLIYRALRNEFPIHELEARL